MITISLLPPMTSAEKARIRQARFRAAHPKAKSEEGRRARAAAIAADPEAYKAKRKAEQRASYLRNKDTVKARSAAWHKAHPEYVREKARERRAKQTDTEREKHNATTAAWYAANADQAKANARAWRLANLERVKNNERLVRYGLTPEALQALRDSQNGACAICLKALVPNTRDEHVDHDHATGAVRGLLCHLCNLALGALRDDETLLNNAVAYLRRARENTQ